MKILIVDDNMVSSYLLQKNLKEKFRGILIRTAASNSEADRIMEMIDDFDLIISDNDSKLNGEKVFEKARKTNKRAKFIFFCDIEPASGDHRPEAVFGKKQIDGILAKIEQIRKSPA